MNGGELTICLKCHDLDAAERFYRVLGLQTQERSDTTLLMKNGHTRLALMTFLPQNCLNFRGADPFAVQATFHAAGIEHPGEPERYAAADYNARADGVSWAVQDPDGNEVFIDTNAAEISDDGRRKRIANLLAATAEDLANLGASEECQRVFRDKVLARFG